MSMYIQSLDKDDKQLLGHLKKDFKKGKSCNNCGKKYRSNKMTVDHIIRVADGADMLDYNNWQVLCLSCHQEKSKEEAKMDFPI